MGSFFIRKCGTSALSLLISRGNRGCSSIRPLLPQSPPLPFFPKPKESSAPPPIATSTTNAVDLPHHFRHGSESREGEGREVGRGAAARGAAKGAGNLPPPKLAARELREYYYLFWSTETRAHPRTKVLPAVASRMAPNGYPFFALFFYCGLCPPFSEFFCDIMNTYASASLTSPQRRSDHGSFRTSL